MPTRVIPLLLLACLPACLPVCRLSFCLSPLIVCLPREVPGARYGNKAHARESDRYPIYARGKPCRNHQSSHRSKPRWRRMEVYKWSRSQAIRQQRCSEQARGVFTQAKRPIIDGE
ncbi:hypothetical protein B0T22DRAFT_455098 [Podospora appendiculata]|uniref:Secreted protein n=1 Tax=Podospora appendiculata TaxID=314037 RepID=A0AAE0XKX2_9PEZI|nr:hypothetical protein B0T22DRAFT_455098 [Podospora appendiculata]